MPGKVISYLENVVGVNWKFLPITELLSLDVKLKVQNVHTVNLLRFVSTHVELNVM